MKTVGPKEARLQLDHLTIIAPTLAAGAEHVRALLGIDMPPGGRHPEMGTHNLLVRLGADVFLEVIARDPEAENPTRKRWFGLDDADAVQRRWDAGFRLSGWVARSINIDADLARHGNVFGHKVRVSRGERCWSISVPPDGSLPANGVAPSVIDWGQRGTPAPAIADLGLTLEKFMIDHPDPALVRALYDDLGVHNAPYIRNADAFRYHAVIGTPDGLRNLY